MSKQLLSDTMTLTSYLFFCWP